MTKIKTIALTILMLSVFDVSAFAHSQSQDSKDNIKKAWYIRVDAGQTFRTRMSFSEKDKPDSLKSKYGNSIFFNIGFGKRLNEKLRTDLTLTYAPKFTYQDKYVEYSRMNIQSIYSTLNLYYDIIRYNNFTPYVMLGGGISHNRTDNFVFVADSSSSPGLIYGDSKTNFAGQLGGGVSYNIAEQVNLDLGYRYIDLGSVKTSDKIVDILGVGNEMIKGRLKTHQVMFGVRYSL